MKALRKQGGQCFACGEVTDEPLTDVGQTTTGLKMYFCPKCMRRKEEIFRKLRAKGVIEDA